MSDQYARPTRIAFTELQVALEHCRQYGGRLSCQTTAGWPDGVIFWYSFHYAPSAIMRDDTRPETIVGAWDWIASQYWFKAA